MTIESRGPGTEDRESLPDAERLDLREDALDLLALTLAHYIGPDSKVGDAIPQRVWDSLHSRGFIETGRDQTGEGETRATREGVEILLRSVEDLARQTEPS